MHLLAASTSAQAVVITRGSAEITGTCIVDFESGFVGGFNDACDVWWQQIDASSRALDRDPASDGSLTNSTFIALGAVDFASITEADLLGYAGAAAAIASPAGGNDIDNVFAVRTVEGNYAKAIVAAHDTRILTPLGPGLSASRPSRSLFLMLDEHADARG